MSTRQVRAYPFRCVEVIYGVVPVLFDAGCHREDVRIKYYVLWRQANLLHKDVICPFADVNASLISICLALLVESHHHCSGTIAFHKPGLPDELLLSSLETD